ncbi:restriction endonuclease subunit S [uncultured Pseudomonas sp.]|uniref:restriction endonuclease subunit S n=1 Tax=uncultured Pseudomonas sp. TaxID=114707 RepID=UPI0025F6C887|nr:restriction endonuclease subunit S [uncultured Pseudomonas sp.]
MRRWPSRIYHYQIWKLDFYAQDQLNKHFLCNFLLKQKQEIKAAGHGASMVHMTKEKMKKLVAPVPPLAEQHHIVAEVHQLMTLCDQLKAHLNQARQVQENLADALVEQAIA